jgi:hypothetical protein
MSKLTLEIPDALHRTVKSVASANGETIRQFFIDAVVEKLKQTSKSKKPMKKTKSKKYITEKEADKMLMPYLKRMIKRIESGEEKTYDKDEFFKKLREEDC